MSKAYWYLCFLLSVILIWYTAKNQISVVDKPLPRILEFEDVCQTENHSNPHSLVLLAPNSYMAKRILQQLCDSSIVGKQFGKVIAYWQTEERDVLQLIGKGVVDLVLIKENFINAFGSDTTYGYERIAAYADYQAYLMSAREKPILSKEYILGKRIGILDYPTSRSGYIAPVRLLKDLDLSLQQVQLVYAKSHRELRELLKAGNVDLISTYWKEEDEKYFSRNYITPLESEISGSKWYLKMLERNTNLKCEVQRILAQQAFTEDYSKYYKNIKIISPCEGK